MMPIIQKAGIVGYVLVAISVLSLGVIIERLIFWCGRRLRGNRLRARLRQQVVQAFHAGDMKRLDSLLDSDSSVQAEALQYLRAHYEASDEGPVDVAVSREVAATNKWLLILDVNGSVAPMLGILGTVLGIMYSFQKMSGAGGQPDTTEMVRGLSMSMSTTAIGLVVALASIIPYNFLASRAHKSQTDLAELLQECWMARPPEEAPHKPEPRAATPESKPEADPEPEPPDEPDGDDE
jgi:biopolymer transport protein ExbB